MTLSRDGSHARPKYERIALSELRQGRLGKHHHFVENVCKQLQALPEEEVKAEDAKAPVAEAKDAGATEVVKH